LKCLPDYSFQGYVKNKTMHEVRIAEDIGNIVLKAASDSRLSSVTKVNISFGQMIQIVPEIFDRAFRETVRDTIAGNAEINIEIVPVRIRCADCGTELLLEDNEFTCRRCRSAEVEIINGKELFIKSIEGE
jgi:hydrogenase nickel incorporation protein HypA/HybF